MTEHQSGDVDVASLRARLAEAEDLLRAIQLGDIDALVVRVANSDQVYTRSTTDEPYRDLVEQMQEGAVVLAVTGEILYCNARFAGLVGVPLESVIGTRFDRFVRAADREEFQALANARSGRYRCQLIDRGADAVEVLLSLTKGKEVDRMHLVVTDLRELHEAYNTRDRAESANRMKDEFLAMLAHELRNPLGAISTAVLVLESTTSSGESETCARDVISRQVSHLSTLVDSLIDVEHVVSGKARLHSRPLELSQAVRRVVSGAMGAIGPNRQVEISTDPVWIDGDEIRIEQVLSGLLANAIGNTPTDGQIRVALRGEGDAAVLTFIDTGTGISADLLPSIFDIFVQGGRALDRAKGGLGLGLALARRLVELHGGTVVASSEGEGRGSTFIVRLPQILAADTPASPSPSPRTRPRRILLIEDHPDAREMLCQLLELAGHEVRTAADGATGLELLKAECPDVALIDIGLPGLDGYQVGKRIREYLNGRSMLMVALTGYGRPADRRKSAEAGFDRHIVKPIDPDELRRLFVAEPEEVGSRQALWL
jgi:signal transduction histidine kinase/ActR/RegA family two-component response regulator